MFNFNARRTKKFQRITKAVILIIKNLLHPAEIDNPLSAHHTRKMGHKKIFSGLEWITGRIINVGLGWNFWDYKHLIFSTPDGQINFFFSLLWLALSPVAFWVDDAARRTYDIFGIEKIAMVESAKASIMASRAQRFSENCKRTWVERAKDPSSKLYPNQDLRDLMGPENKS